MKHLLPLLALAAGALPAVRAQSTISPDAPFAYGANIGWIDLRGDGTHGVRVGEFFLAGKAWSANCGWIDFGSGSPANGHAYSNASVSDCGVNNDGRGNLSGFAYGANIGWISFAWAGLNDPNRPHFDPATGIFSGYAYSANTGWINLGDGLLATASIDRPDSDADGIDDAWEMQWFGSLKAAGIGTDRDGDGQSDAAEAIADTDPLSASDLLRIVSHTYTNGMTTVSLVFTTTPARLYRIEHSTDLKTWTDSGQGTFSPDEGATTARKFSFATGARRFFRVVAVRPL
ncbi:MAG TPA: thrombospondin type 3 repeat-containing protein [Opitutaceae bacterium]|nr:thrombospondin type 3 repeat-containing protein [Opitutaceae bacterium]